MGGQGPPGRIANSEEFDGSSWTDGGNLNTGHGTCAGLGLQTAAICISGSDGGAPIANTEYYDGSSWTEGADVNSERREMIATGIQTTGIVIGGLTPGGVTDIVEEYNGSSWSEIADINTSRKHQAACGGSGAATAAILLGGENASSSGLANTEEWDGTALAEIADLSTAIGAAGGPATSGVNDAFYGAGRPDSTACEEFTQALNVKTITD